MTQYHDARGKLLTLLVKATIFGVDPVPLSQGKSLTFLVKIPILGVDPAL